MIRANRPIRSRMDYYAASADPGRPSLGTSDPSASGYWRSSRATEEMRRRPEALRTGAGNLRPIGMARPYVSGMGKPAIERADIETGADGEEFWSEQGVEVEAEEEGYQRQQVRNPLRGPGVES